MLQAVPLAGRHLPIVVGSAPDALEEDTSSSNECVTPTAADVWRELFELEGPSSDEVGELNELRSRTLRVERVELDSDGRVRLGHAEIVELYARSSQHNGKGKSKNTCNRRTRPGGGDDCGKQQNKAETERFAATVVANTNQTLLEAEKAPELPETQEQLADEGQRYHALPLGHHPERSMEAATWSPEHRAFLRKTIICRRAMMISYTYCVVSVFGLGVAGRLFDPGGGSSTPKMLLVEVYSVWDSAVHKMTFTLAQVASVLRGHELMWRAGRKRDLVDRLVRQLYFEYHILIPGRLLQRGQEAREESASSTVAAQPGLVLEHVEDPPEHLHLPTVGELIEHHSNPAASKVSTCPQLRQVLKVASEPREHGATKRRRDAELRRQQQEAEAAKRAELWLSIPKLKRGRVWARAVRWDGSLFVLTSYQFIHRLVSAVVRLFHPRTCQTFTATFSLVEAAKLCNVRSDVAEWTADVRRKAVSEMMKRVRLKHFGNGDTAALVFLNRVGLASPGIPQRKRIDTRRSRRPWEPERYVDLREARVDSSQWSKSDSSARGPSGLSSCIYVAIERVNGVRCVCKVLADRAEHKNDALDLRDALIFNFYIPTTTTLPVLGACLPAGSEYRLRLEQADLWRILDSKAVVDAVFEHSTNSSARTPHTTLVEAVKRILGELTWVLDVSQTLAAACHGLYAPPLHASTSASVVILHCPSCIFHRGTKIRCGEKHVVMDVRVYQMGSRIKVCAFDLQEHQLYITSPATEIEGEIVVSWLSMSAVERTINIGAFLEGLALEIDAESGKPQLVFQSSQPVEIGELAGDLEKQREQAELFTAHAVLKVKSRVRRNTRLTRR